MADHYSEMLEDEETEKLVLNVLAEFFQDSFDDDSGAVSDWLVQGGTSPDLFVHLVVALRRKLDPKLRAEEFHEVREDAND